ncbi:hypothetical protein IJG12_04060 [Candidatus Saccharibacteria bacterium]|nr:hypothetical protein [Candidatus Saccharibacteria bacterium]
MNNHNKPSLNYENENRTKDYSRGNKVLNVNNQEIINGYDLKHITSKNIHTLGKAALYDDLSYLDALNQYDQSRAHSSSLAKNRNKVLDISLREKDLIEWEEDAPQKIVGYVKHVLGVRDITNIRASDMADRIKNETTRDLDRLRVIDPEYYREKLESLNQKQKKKINKILNMWSLPDDLEMMKKNTKNGEIDFFTVLLNKDDSGDYTLGTEAFRKFLRWHNHFHAIAEADYSEKVPLLKQTYKERLKELVKSRQLPNSCLEKINIIDEIPAFLSDGFETIGIGCAGYFDGEKIVVDPEDLNEGTSHIFNHELTHACIEGNQLKLSEEDEGRYKTMNPNNRPTYSPGKSQKSFDSYRCLKSAIRAMQEGCCEYIARVITNDEKNQHSSYEGEQNMVEFIIRLSGGELGWDDFIEAYSTDESSIFDSFTDKVIQATGEKDIWLYCGAAFLASYGR